jgi:ribonuclease HI
VPIAEYWGLILALSMAHELGATDVEVMMDAEWIPRQVNGVYRLRSEHLRPYLEAVHAWSATF